MMIILECYPNTNVPCRWTETNDETYKIPEGGIVMRTKEERMAYEKLHKIEIESFVLPVEETGLFDKVINAVVEFFS